MPDRQAALSQALTRIELREAALLSWGAVDAIFTRPEIISLIGDGLPAGMSPDGRPRRDARSRAPRPDA